MYIQFVKDENGNCVVEYTRDEYRATEGMTHMYDYEIDGRIPDLFEENKLYVLERNGEMVDGCIGFKSVAQHVGDNKIFTVLRKEGEYHDDENNLHLRIVHPVAVRDIGAAELDSDFDTDFGDNWLDEHEGDQDVSAGKKEKKNGWEGTWNVTGIEPIRRFRETIIACLVDNGYVDSVDRITAIDDWHYQIAGEMRLWKKKEDLLTKKINEALKIAGWNVAVNVQMTANDDASFIIDLTNHTFGAYYALLQYDSHYGEFDVDVQVSRNPDEFYLQIIRNIFMNEKDSNARVEDIQSLLENGHCEADDDYILEFRPRLLMRDGYFVSEDPYDTFGFPECIEYVDMPDFEEEEDPYEARDEYENEILESGQSLYCLTVK